MAGRGCVQRLQKEYKAICKDPVPHVIARPSSTDILEWHYVLEGSPGTPFEGGHYHGKLKFPADYPFKPPSITMITPNGRFAPNKRICMSMSDFHPETWNPMWSVASILTGLLSFMTDTLPTAGSVNSTMEEKRRLATESLAQCCKNASFRRMFPEYVDKLHQQQRQEAEEEEERERQSAACREAGSQHGSAPLNRSSSSSSQKEGQAGKKRAGLKLPLWATALLVALLASVMALPLLSLGA